MDLKVPTDFHDQYKKVLAECWTTGCDEELLGKVYELGSRGYREGLTLDALLEMHHATTYQLLPSIQIDPARYFRIANNVSVELLAPYQNEVNRLRDYQVAQESLTAKLRQQARQLDRANEELKVARAAAEAGANAKAEFLAHMSHEIRTPLNAIIGMAGLLVETELGLQQRDFAETIRSSGDHLLTIINDILDFSKIEAGKIELENLPFRLSQCVEDCLDLVAARAAEKGIDIGYFIESDMPDTVESDVGRIRQVLVNLLSNAVKFTSKGAVTVTVSGKRLAEPSRYELRFAVRDTGTGIAKPNQKRLFQPFSQVDASTTRLYGGTGLGLSISWNLVQLLGGTMWVESEVGEGSTFYFTVHATTHATSEGAQGPAEVRAPAGHRVLIVDGNVTNRRILSAYMRMWNLMPFEAANGSDALAFLSGPGESVSLVLVEYELQDMTGMEFARRVRQLPESSELAMILFSQGVRKPNEINEAGFRGFLSKPIKPSTLHNIVIDVLSNGTAESSAVPQPSQTRKQAEVSLRILVAEDNSVNQKVAAAILGRLGYTADIVANGLEAVAAVAMKPYDIVLMDVQMPEMDGLTATQELCRRFSPLERPHIVGLTANVTEEARRQCLAAGMDTYISKPVTIDKLTELLRRCTPRALRSGADVANAVNVPAAEPTTPARMDNAQVVFWRTQSQARSVELSHIASSIADETWKLRSAADRGDHVKGKAAARQLRKLVAGGVDSEVIQKLVDLEEGSSEGFLRSGIAAVADIQLDIEKLQKIIRSAKPISGSTYRASVPIDQADIKRLLYELGGKEMLISLIDDFLREAQRLVESIGRSILERDSGTARAAAHSLKGATSTFPLPHLQTAAESIETALKNGRLEALPTLWSTLADEHGRSAAMLKVVVESLDAT